jgi:hypothetical protein
MVFGPVIDLFADKMERQQHNERYRGNDAEFDQGALPRNVDLFHLY